MNARQKVAAVLYGGTAMISLVLGSIYLFRGSFMPYHGEALGQGWAEVEPALQVLILALMDVSGAGWLALGLAALSLILGPFRRRETWSRWLIPGLLLVVYLPTLAATLQVLSETPATPPWWGNAAACAATLAALGLDAPWGRESTG